VEKKIMHRPKKKNISEKFRPRPEKRIGVKKKVMVSPHMLLVTTQRVFKAWP
jgi:hypothetical protein